VPGTLPDGLVLVGAPVAEDARDALASRGASLNELPAGARVGTSSLRRRSQLLAIRPDLEVVSLRGNVDTRLRKLTEGGYDAIVLALAGLRRLGREREASAIFDPSELVPAPGQGILALEARTGDARVASAAQSISDTASLVRLEAERAVMGALDVSCHTPVGAYAELAEAELRVRAYVGLPDGSEWLTDQVRGDHEDPAGLGRLLAERMLAAGAAELLRRSEAAAGAPA
jgi:hydroxymethylbilane synthase